MSRFSWCKKWELHDGDPKDHFDHWSWVDQAKNEIAPSRMKSKHQFGALLVSMFASVSLANQAIESSPVEKRKAPSRVETERLVTYPHPSGIRPSDEYQIQVFQKGKATPLFVYVTRPPEPASPGVQDGSHWYRSNGISYSFAKFSYEGTVSVEVRKKTGGYRNVVIRPSRLNVSGKMTDSRTVRFDLSRSGKSPGQKISIEFGGETRERLLLFADPLEQPELLPDRAAPGVQIVRPGQNFGFHPDARTIVFEPGVHEVGFREVPAGIRHIYLAGGAYVRGAFDFGKRGPVMVNGRGVLSGEQFRYRACRAALEKECADKPYLTAVHLLSYRDVDRFHLEGITLMRPPHYATNGWGATRVVLENFKILGSFRWQEDGLDVTSQSTVKDCFVNAMDDAFKMYFDGARVSNCVVWQGVNGAVFQYGWYKKNGGGNEVTDIDVIHADWPWGMRTAPANDPTNNNAVFGYVPGKDFQGTIANETYRRIRIETPVLRVFGFRVPEGQIVRNLRFEDVSVAGLIRDSRWKANYFWADGGAIEGLTFSGLTVGGERITVRNAESTGALELIGVKARFE